jgi:ribonuclease P protein component
LINPGVSGLPKRARLQQSSEFNAVFEQNSFRINASEFLILARKNDFTFSRLGMIISKRTTPTSVKRNLFKRLTREAFRHSKLNEIPLDIIVLGRPKTNKMTKKELLESLAMNFLCLNEQWTKHQ